MVCVVICEKNNVAQRVASILSSGSYRRTFVNKVPVYRFPWSGTECAVIGMRGHILNFDYPKEFKSWRMEDLQLLAQARPIKVPTVGWLVSAIKHLSKEADQVIVATDFDREGELIGLEVVSVMDIPKNMKIKRARFSALTGPEIRRAFENLVDLDMNLATAAETRQIVDLAWGAVLTRFMSTSTGKVGADFLSVGRVQSPTLAIVVDREKEIEKFVPKPFWEIMVDLEKKKHFFAKHAHGVFWEKELADAVLLKVKDAKIAKVLNAIVEEKAERPPSPFNTTLFLADASRLGLSAARAMAVAEKLYNDGLISYPRTDNTVYPPSLPLKGILNELRKSSFAKEAEEILAQETIRATRGPRQSTDHPPIHPVGAATREQLRGDNWIIYELVVRRFLTTLAPDALVLRTAVDLDVEGEHFIANGHEILARGWYSYYPYIKPKEIFIPELEKGEDINVVGVRGREGKTEPPKRYTQGALIRDMEKQGLGTKSTRHEIIQKLYDRRYVEGGEVRPTTMGRAVIQALEDNADIISKPDMTRQLENDMTEIAEGRKVQKDVVMESQEMLERSLDILVKHKEGIRNEVLVALRDQSKLGDCPICKVGALIIRKSKRGKRFVACTSYPKCTNTYPLPQYGTVIKNELACKSCGGLQIKLAMKKRRPETICLKIDCDANKRRLAKRKKQKSVAPSPAKTS
jgi:DNA topoisomerase-1